MALGTMMWFLVLFMSLELPQFNGQPIYNKTDGEGYSLTINDPLNDTTLTNRKEDGHSEVKSREGYERDLMVVLPVMQGESDISRSSLEVLYTKPPVTEMIFANPEKGIRRSDSVHNWKKSHEEPERRKATGRLPSKWEENKKWNPHAEFYVSKTTTTTKSPLDYGYPDSFKFVQQLNELPKNHKPDWGLTESTITKKKQSTYHMPTRYNPFQMFESVKPLEINKLFSIRTPDSSEYSSTTNRYFVPSVVMYDDLFPKITTKPPRTKKKPHKHRTKTSTPITSPTTMESITTSTTEPTTTSTATTTTTSPTTSTTVPTTVRCTTVVNVIQEAPSTTAFIPTPLLRTTTPSTTAYTTTSPTSPSTTSPTSPSTISPTSPSTTSVLTTAPSTKSTPIPTTTTYSTTTTPAPAPETTTTIYLPTMLATTKSPIRDLNAQESQPQIAIKEDQFIWSSTTMTSLTPSSSLQESSTRNFISTPRNPTNSPLIVTYTETDLPFALEMLSPEMKNMLASLGVLLNQKVTETTTRKFIRPTIDPSSYSNFKKIPLEVNSKQEDDVSNEMKDFLASFGLFSRRGHSHNIVNGSNRVSRQDAFNETVDSNNMIEGNVPNVRIHRNVHNVENSTNNKFQEKDLKDNVTTGEINQGKNSSIDPKEASRMTVKEGEIMQKESSPPNTKEALGMAVERVDIKGNTNDTTKGLLNSSNPKRETNDTLANLNITSDMLPEGIKQQLEHLGFWEMGSEKDKPSALQLRSNDHVFRPSTRLEDLGDVSKLNNAITNIKKLSSDENFKNLSQEEIENHLDNITSSLGDKNNTSREEPSNQINEIIYKPHESKNSIVTVLPDVINNNSNTSLDTIINSPNPLSYEELQQLYDSSKNDVKRQEPTSEEVATNFPDVTTILTEAENITETTTSSSTTTTSTTPAPVTDSRQVENNNAPISQLAESFGGGETAIDPPSQESLPTQRPNGLYFYVDWNSFLRVGTTEENIPPPVNIRFSPKAGNPRYFLPISIP